MAWDAADVPAALTRLDRARADGLWLAGYASYELGYALESRLLPLMPQGRRLPLLRFGCYAGSGTSAPVQPDGALRGLQPRWDAGRYAQAFQAVHDYIGAGDIYQANLTFPIEAQAQGTASGLYAALATRQSVGHGVLVEQQGGPALLSRSPDLFTVETYATVHQMVSTVEGQLLPGTGLSDILRALYPCGSITGAPKLRAMQIIRELEPWPREAYCGTIGWAAPDGRAEFNVAIRTVMLEGARATLNVGGGLVWDSTADAEYEEALWKARYAMFQPEPA